MARITLDLPDDTPMAPLLFALREMADNARKDLRCIHHGNAHFSIVERRAAPPKGQTATNASVVKMPRRARQYIPNPPSGGPSTAA